MFAVILRKDVGKGTERETERETETVWGLFNFKLITGVSKTVRFMTLSLLTPALNYILWILQRREMRTKSIAVGPEMPIKRRTR